MLTSRQMVLSLHHAKLCLQAGQQLLLRLRFAHHGRHLLPQMTHDQDVDFGRSHTLHKLIHLDQTHTLLGSSGFVPETDRHSH